MDYLVPLIALYGLAGGLYVIVLDRDVDCLIEKMQKRQQATGLSYNQTMRERTKEVQHYAAFVFTVIPASVFGIAGQFFSYSGPWWLPSVVAIPILVFSLAFAASIHVSMNAGTRQAFTTFRDDAIGDFKSKSIIAFFVTTMATPLVAMVITPSFSGDFVYLEGFMPAMLLFVWGFGTDYLTYSPFPGELFDFGIKDSSQ